MEAHEASHIIQSPVERPIAIVPVAAEVENPEVTRLEQAETFRRNVALWVAFVAMVLALASMSWEQNSKDVINANINTSDTYQFFQAKNIRQTDNQIAADELETLLVLQNPPEPVRSQLEQRLARYRSTVTRYESEPETGEGKKELLLKADALKVDRDRLQLKEHNFHYAASLLQIAIVLGSVSILALSHRVLMISGAAAGFAVLLLLNGYFVGLHLPF